MSIQLIIGLANPGKEYANTRHNAGSWFIESIAYAAKVQLRFESKFQGMFQTVHHNQAVYHLFIPSTFMNHSGQAVRACMSYQKIPPENILIAHDEIDLPVGTVKLKFDGGDGGHNGLKDVIRHLNTKQFYRLRIGVGHPGNKQDVVNYVLSNPSKSDKQQIDQALREAEDVLPLILNNEINKAMQQLHTNSSGE